MQFFHQGFLPPFTVGMLALTGCVMSYPAFALIRNTTRFEVGLGGLRVRHGPLPLRRSRELARDEIADLVVRKTLTDRRESQYTLMLRRHDKRRLVPLLYEIPTRKEGLELANAIKKALGLPTIDDDDEHDDGVPVPTATASVARG